MMTNDEIDAMPAGWDLDDKVELHIFGIQPLRGYAIPDYSTDINLEHVGSLLIRLAEICKAKSMCFEMGDRPGGWWVNLILPEVEHVHHTEYTASPTIPLTVCRALLKAKFINVQQPTA